MTTITNVDTGETRDATIITKPSAGLNWCIATWPAPDYGWSKVDGNGHGWQVVRLDEDGNYTYNASMAGGFRDSLEDVRKRIAGRGYELLS